MTEHSYLSIHIWPYLFQMPLKGKTSMQIYIYYGSHAPNRMFVSKSTSSIKCTPLGIWQLGIINNIFTKAKFHETIVI